jgi:hypothetical protein
MIECCIPLTFFRVNQDEFSLSAAKIVAVPELRVVRIPMRRDLGFVNAAIGIGTARALR